GKREILYSLLFFGQFQNRIYSNFLSKAQIFAQIFNLWNWSGKYFLILKLEIVQFTELLTD
ncbi:MAG: hypothetical protein C6I01_01270, partial [Epsilonproteobacteria bacterium]|nr:hypothetical protein [Campylobacterota bacterium]